jgi:hypothetical protein
VTPLYQEEGRIDTTLTMRSLRQPVATDGNDVARSRAIRRWAICERLPPRRQEALFRYKRSARVKKTMKMPADHANDCQTQ